MSTQHERMYQRIEQHGRKLLAIFPNATERDPVKLCKKLRRIEARGHRHALALCNDAHYLNETDHETIGIQIIAAARKILKTDRVWLNQDPRGYALKFHPTRDEDIHRDWGGYGLIAPDLSED